MDIDSRSDLGTGLDVSCGLDLGVGGPGVLSVAALVDLDPAGLSESALVEVVGRFDEQVAWLHAVRAAHLVELARRKRTTRAERRSAEPTTVLTVRSVARRRDRRAPRRPPSCGRASDWYP